MSRPSTSLRNAATRSVRAGRSAATTVLPAAARCLQISVPSPQIPPVTRATRLLIECFPFVKLSITVRGEPVEPCAAATCCDAQNPPELSAGKRPRQCGLDETESTRARFVTVARFALVGGVAHRPQQALLE